MTELKGKRILLGLTGGIAAYKAARVDPAAHPGRRRSAGRDDRGGLPLHHAGHHAGAFRQSGAYATCGTRACRTTWRISNCRAAAMLIVVAPASADFLAKLAHGSVRRPAVHAVSRARMPAAGGAGDESADVGQSGDAAQRRSSCARTVSPSSGPPAATRPAAKSAWGACSRRKKSVEEIEAFSSRKLLAGKRVLVTAGPTFEPIDTVRGITNTSSGKMGYAVARAARDAGAVVTLVSGPTALAAPRAWSASTFQPRSRCTTR